MKTCLIAVVVILLRVSAFANVIAPTCKGVLHGRAITADGHAVPGLGLELFPLSSKYASFIAPATRTNEVGEYRFEHVCNGRFTVLVDDVRAGYPPSFLIRLMRKNPEVELTTENPERELSLNVPERAAILEVRARDSRTKATLPTVQVMLRTSKYKMHDWLAINQDSSTPLLIPADMDLLCRVSADGYREWRAGKRKGKPARLPSEGKLTLEVELQPLR
jgi:hypothetical protein